MALFSPRNTPDVAAANVALVDHVLDAVLEHHIGSGSLEWNLTDHVYTIGLLALAARSREVFEALHYSDITDAVLQVPAERVSPLFMKCVRHLITGYGSALTAPAPPDVVRNQDLRRTFIHHEQRVLHGLLSLLYLGFHVDRDSSLGLRAALVPCVDDLADRLAKGTAPVAREQLESLELFARFLASTGAADGARLLSAVNLRMPHARSGRDAVIRQLEDAMVLLNPTIVAARNLAIFGPLSAAPAEPV